MSKAHAQKLVSCVGMAITWMSNPWPGATFMNYMCTVKTAHYLTELVTPLITICKREACEPACTNGYGTLFNP